MITDPRSDGIKNKWEHVHECPRCGHVVRAEDIPRTAIISGVLTCPKCEWSGPINVQIVKEKPAEGGAGDVKWASRGEVV